MTTTTKPTTPADVIRDTLDVLQCEQRIGVAPDNQAWAEEIVKQMNNWSMLTNEAQNRQIVVGEFPHRRPYSAH